MKMSSVRRKIATSESPLFLDVKYMYRKARYFGLQRYCSVCDSRIRAFYPGGAVSIRDCVCPVCYSFERHRLIWLFFRHNTDLFMRNSRKMLHIAPEPCMSQAIRTLSHIDHVTLDIEAKCAIKGDVSQLCFPDNTFDIIYASHVLEHVVEDRKAMGEFFRVLKSGGWAVLQVPIMRDITFEDPTITDSVERLRIYGQHDHVRIYGSDYYMRLEQAGFHVKRVKLDIQRQPKLSLRFGLSDEEIAFCTKDI